MSSDDPCKKISLWAQYGPTCWFNAGLTVMFHSQHSRNMLLKFFETLQKKTTFQNLAEHIVKYKYVKSNNLQKERDFFYDMRPEFILRYLHKKYPLQFKKDAANYGSRPDLILNKMYKILGLKSLMFEIVEVDQSKLIFYDSFNHFEIDEYGKENSYNYIRVSEKSLNNILNNTKVNPDVLIINNMINTDIQTNQYEKYFYSQNLPYYNLELQKDVNKDLPWSMNIEELKSLKDNIIYNGTKYILDSVILSNYNIGIDNHVIAGVTCNNQRYVYNGWTRNSKDPAIELQKHIENIQEEIKEEGFGDHIPCDLIKFNWDVNSNNDFCINLKNCELPTVQKIVQDNQNASVLNVEQYRLCFNFYKGLRILVYVKEELASGILDFETKKFQKFKLVEDLKDVMSKIVEETNASDEFYVIYRNILNEINMLEKLKIILRLIHKDITIVQSNLESTKKNQKDKILLNLIDLKVKVLLLYFYRYHPQILFKESTAFDSSISNELIQYPYNNKIVLKTVDVKDKYNNILKYISDLLYSKSEESKINGLIEELLFDLLLYISKVKFNYASVNKDKRLDNEEIINFLVDFRNVLIQNE